MIIKKCNDYYIVKIFNNYDVNFLDIDNIKNLFKKIIKRLKDKYNISGLIKSDVYVNFYYGVIIEMHVIEIYDNIDLNINIHINDNFLVNIDSKDILDYKDVYYYNGCFYGTYTELSDSEVIYKNVDTIINNGIKVC